MTKITLADQDKPLRRDAELNRRRILDAARELFAQRGLGVTLNEIARYAGVGVGTVYRRFPDRSKLIDDLFQQRIGDLVALAEEAIADPDPWRGLTRFLERSLELQARDSALKDLIVEMPGGLARVSEIRARLMPLGVELVRRARESGAMSDDIAAEDLAVVQLMIGAVIDAARGVEPDLWRRYLQILLRGLSAQPQTQAPLATPPLSPEQVDHVMSQPSPAARRSSGAAARDGSRDAPRGADL